MSIKKIRFATHAQTLKFLIAFAVVIALGAMAFALIRPSMPPLRPVTILLDPPIDLTGDERLKRGLVDFHEAVGSRAQQMASAIKRFMVVIPNQDAERPAATLRLGTGGQTGAQIDHPLFEWKGRIKEPPDLKFTTTSVDARGSEASDDARFAIQFTREQHDSKDRDEHQPGLTVTVSTKLGLESSGCTRNFTDAEVFGENNVSLATVIDFVAACVVGEVFLSYGPDELFRDAYTDLMQIRDRNRLIDTIVGMERYEYYFDHWQEQTTEVDEALKSAVQRFARPFSEVHNGSSSQYQLNQYLLVHAATADVLGPGTAISVGRNPDQGSMSLLKEHLDAAFASAPYKDASWSKALALEAAKRSDEAEKAWSDIAKHTQQTSAAGRRRALRAESRVAAAHWAEKDWSAALIAHAELKPKVEGLDSRVKKDASAPPDDEDELVRAGFYLDNALTYLGVHGEISSQRELAKRSVNLLMLLKDLAGIDKAAAAAGQSVRAALAPTAIAGSLIQDCIAEKADTCDSLRKSVVDRQNAAATTFLREASCLLQSAENHLRPLRARLCARATRLEECADVRKANAPLLAPSPEMEEVITRIDETEAIVAEVRLYGACQAIVVEEPSCGAAEPAFDTARRFAKRSKYARAFDGLLADCVLHRAVLGAGVLTAQEEESALLRWAASPPSPQSAAEQETALRECSAEPTSASAPALSLLRYATLWNAVDRYAEWLSSGNAESLDEYVKQQLRSRKLDDWTIKQLKTTLGEIWTKALGEKDATNVYSALAAIGDSMKIDQKRGNRRALENITPDDLEALADCDQHGSKCLVTNGAQAYNEWIASLAAPGSERKLTDILNEALRRALSMRDQVERRAGGLLQGLVKAFFKGASESLGDERVRLAALRLLFRCNPILDRNIQIGMTTMVISRALTAARTDDKKIDDATRASMNNLVAVDPIQQLVRRGIVFTRRDGDDDVTRIRTIAEAVEAIGGMKAGKTLGAGACQLSSGSVAEERQKWLRRFAAHAAANESLYVVNSVADVPRRNAQDLLAAYARWCENRNPLEIEAVAIDELIREDRRLRAVAPTALADASFARYLLGVAVVNEDPGGTVELTQSGRTPELQFLRAQALVKQERGGLALGPALEAASALEEAIKGESGKTTGPILDAATYVTLGDAYLLFASAGGRLTSKEADNDETLTTDPQRAWREHRGAYLQAIKAYERARQLGVQADGSMMPLRLAAALIEVGNYDEALGILNGSPMITSCDKAKLLAAIAQYSRGEWDRARAMSGAARLLSFRDLNRNVPGARCPVDREPVFAGAIAKSIGALILRDRSQAPTTR
jgi:hypothetical protein